MAAPVVTAITFTPDPGVPGTTVNAVVSATDPDPVLFTGVGRAIDAAGNPSADLAWTLSVPNPLTYELEADDPAVVITPDPNVEGGFFVTLPS
jgi:hypothetical protein